MEEVRGIMLKSYGIPCAYFASSAAASAADGLRVEVLPPTVPQCRFSVPSVLWVLQVRCALPARVGEHV